MDREPEELQFLGVYGIYREAYNTIASRRKIFSQINLVFILPLSFMYLAQIKISGLVYSKMIQNGYVLGEAQMIFLFFMVLYHIFFLNLSLLSTTVVAYTIASTYTRKEITFNKVVSVVPTVWKRLTVTYPYFLLLTFVFMFLYNVISFPIIAWTGFAASFGNSVPCKILFVIVIIIYVSGLVFIGVIFQLASVVSVLEESYGYKSFSKSEALIKGKMWTASVIFITVQVSFVGVLFVFENLVGHGRIGVIVKVIVGISCLLLLSILIQFSLVTQTVVYFVCKSYHRENIEESGLISLIIGSLLSR